MNIGGADRELVFDFNAACLFEEATGKGFYEVIASPAEMGKATSLRAILWAGLASVDPTVTLRHVGSWLAPGELQRITKALGEAAAAAAPKPDADANPTAGQ